MSTATVAPLINHAPTKPLDSLPQEMWTARKGVTIVSVYPGDLRKQCRHNGTVEYHIPAAPRGGYSQYTVYDTGQWVRFASERGPKYDQWSNAPIPAIIVATDLVQTWAGSVLKPKNGAAYTIGVGVIKEDKPAPEEVSALRNTQHELFNLFIQEANSLHIAGKGVDITDLHRTSARYLLDQGAENLPWFPKIDFAEVKTCIACSKKIYKTALRCEHCTTFLPELYIQWGLAPEGDEAVRNFLAQAKPRQQTEIDPRTAGKPKV